jgi:type I restriction enzyme S subunit
LRFRDKNGEHFVDWEEKKLGDLAKITTGKLDANAMVQDGKYRFYTCAKDYFRIDKYAFDTEALLISGNGANVGYIHYYKGKFNAYQRTYVLDRIKENIIYLKFYLDNFLYERIHTEKKEGNTPYIVMSTLSEMEILLPSLPEQQKIANFLSSIDAKIESTNQHINQTQSFKKGLFQQLFV